MGGWILGYPILYVEQMGGLHSMHVLREEIVGNNNYKMKKRAKTIVWVCGEFVYNCYSHKLSRFVYSIEGIT